MPTFHSTKVTTLSTTYTSTEFKKTLNSITMVISISVQVQFQSVLENLYQPNSISSQIAVLFIPLVIHGSSTLLLWHHSSREALPRTAPLLLVSALVPAPLPSELLLILERVSPTTLPSLTQTTRHTRQSLLASDSPLALQWISFPASNFRPQTFSSPTTPPLELSTLDLDLSKLMPSE